MSSDPVPERLFDEPGLSRQWVLRRLQRALTLDLAAAALQRGIAATTRRDATVASQLAQAAQERADTVRQLVESLGSAPYSSLGLARAAAATGGRLMGLLGSWSWRRAVERLAEHTLSEYDLLRVLVDGAPGVDPGLVDRVPPLLASAGTSHRSLTGEQAV